jgi:hypothetical protein
MVAFKSLLTAILVFAAVASASAKPRVLILADSIYQNSGATMTKALQDQADVVYITSPASEAFTTQTALVNLDTWLGKEKWDLIYFNFGSADLTYRAPGMKSFRILSRNAGGVIATTPEDYQKNLSEIVKKLSNTNAKLIWGNTLPIGTSLIDIHAPGSEVEYNNIAAKIMDSAGIPIIDMHTYGESLIDYKKQKSGVDLSYFNKQPLYVPVIEAICKTLSLSVPVIESDPKKRKK